ncbi:MAG: hypothetical protein LC776_14935, partial [Acidobacteria bacterium]|nr:hypothetical protein [Acidobacteriota bacterium]
PAPPSQAQLPATTAVSPDCSAEPVCDTTLPTTGPQPLPEAGQPATPTPGPDAAANGAPPAHQEQTEDFAGELASLTFPGNVAGEMPADGDAEVRDQLANLLCELVGAMNRRESIQLLGLLGLLGWAATTISSTSPLVNSLNTDEVERLAGAIASPSRVDTRVIDHIDTIHRHCKLQEDALGPRAVLDTAIAEQNLVRSLLVECPIALQPRLLSVYSDISTSIGFYFFDLDNVENAMRYWDQARAAAQKAKNIELSIYALDNMSYAAAWHDKDHAAIDLAAAAQSLVSKTGDPLMRVCAATAVARAYSLDGQYKVCLVELEKATEGLLSTKERPAGSPAYWYHEGWLISQKSRCLLRLDKPREAAASTRAALTLYDRSHVRSLASCTLVLGSALVQCNEIDEAASVIADAATLIAQIRSVRLVKELRTTRSRMQPWQDVRAVKELDDHLVNYGLVSNSST